MNASYTVNQKIWLSDLVISCILLLISFYLSAALVYHQIKVEKPLKAKFFQMKLETKYRVLSKYTCILIGIFSIIRCLFDIVVKSTVEWNAVFSNQSVQPTKADETACNVSLKMSVSALYFGNVFVYVYLWLRQSIFYVQSTLKVLYNNKLKAFSFFILVFYMIFGLSLFIAFSIVVRYVINTAGFCLFQAVANNDTSFIKLLTVWSCLSIVMQMSLLSLFIYPLLKQARWNKNPQGTGNHRMLRVVKKAVILASVCLVTDICTLIYVSLVISSGRNNERTNVVYSGNLVVNHLVTIACFGFWRKLLWPWSIKCQINNPSTIANVTSTSYQTCSQQRTKKQYL